MADYQPPLDDIRFVLRHIGRLDELAKLEPFTHADCDTVFGALDEFGRFLAAEWAPLNDTGDTRPSTIDGDTVTTTAGFVDAYRAYAEAGWGSVPFDPDQGGGGFPWLVGIAMQEMLNSANLSLAMAPLLTQGAIDAVRHHGSEGQRERYLRKLVSGEWTGTMNLTEPSAGSDVGALRTRAVRQDDGRYRINGQKIFITFGEHDLTDNILHLVLARTPDAPPGTKGISCFLVPKYLVDDDGSTGARNDVKVLSIEHKLGIKASPTCVMAYGDDGDGAVGELLGEENAGMRTMFTMMNNARLGVGVQGLGVAERAWQAAVDYARERRQGRAPGAPAGEQSLIVEHPDVRRMLLTMKASVEAMRALCFLNAGQIDLANHHPDEAVRTEARELVELLIPLSKSLSTDWAETVTSIGIQVHGGMGYIEETGAAQYYRDAKITQIYEGTNGIQGMDLVGRKLPMRAGGVVWDHLARMRATVEELGGDDDLAPIRQGLDNAVAATADATTWLLEHGAADPRDALAGATPYQRMMAVTTAGWLMARSALAARRLLDGGRDDEAFLDAKVVTARFFCQQLLPEVAGRLASVTAGHHDLFAIDADHL